MHRWWGRPGPFLAPFFLRKDFDKETIVATEKRRSEVLGHVSKDSGFLLHLGFDYSAYALPIVTMSFVALFGSKIGTELAQAHVDGPLFDGSLKRPCLLPLCASCIRF